MSNELDARLHGHGGGAMFTSTAAQDAPNVMMTRAAYSRLQDQQKAVLGHLLEIEKTCPCGARPEARDTHSHVSGCPVELALDIQRAVLASNPSPEPDDAEVREAVEWLYSMAPAITGMRQKLQLVERALRSQAGQGMVVTADEFREAFNESSVSWERRASRMNAILATQEPREL